MAKTHGETSGTGAARGTDGTGETGGTDGTDEIHGTGGRGETRGTGDRGSGPGGAAPAPDTTEGVDEAVRAELIALRDSIDNIDAAVVHMLAERFKCTQRVGRLKADHDLPPADPAREARQIARLRELAVSAKLDPAFAEKLLNFVIAEVIRHHETIART
ncbi:chorismate mutase [Streptomyces sp. Amel2xB2]|nr:chorismate mutase [Streptomyces sp. Amel2xB2]